MERKKMNGKYLIVDLNTRHFVQCWTEGNTVFLTKDIAKAELFKTGAGALRNAEDYQEDASRFLDDEEREISDVNLVAYQVKCKYTFHNIEDSKE
jgi:hypothetical protein